MPSLVSIIMPAYNAEPFIAQAIQSVLHQEYPHWELLVIDDGSNDGTAQIVRSFGDDRLRYVYQENRGQAAALNHGLELARGEYITTLDVDDWLTPDSLVDRVSFLDAHPRYGVVYGDGYYCDAGGETFLTFSDHMPCGQSGDVYDLLIVSPFYGTGAAVMQRRDMLARFQIRYDESIVWCQDWDFYIRLAEVGRFGFVATKTIRYRIHSDSMTEAMPGGRRLESLIRLREKVLGSQRFHSVSSSQKSAFFYDFIVKDLDGDFVKQERIINSREFSAIDKNEQARIQRLAANRYLLKGEQTSIAKRWLWSAWRKVPFEPKTTLVLLTSMFSPEVTRRIIQSRQSLRREQEQLSPFEIVIPLKGE